MASGGSDGDGDEVPHHLMPVAAVLGTFCLVATVRAVSQIYRNVRYGTKITAEMRLRGEVPKPLKSRQFAVLLLSIAGSALAYGYVTALVNNAMASSDVLFDPFDILGVASGANSTIIKTAYRTLSKTAHPDKGGDPDSFRRLTLAYKALTDATSRANWEKFGHPDGPQTQTLSFALPQWLLHPEGTTAAVLVLLYLGMFAALIAWVFKFVRGTESANTRAEMETSVAGGDMAYLASRLSPDSTHLDVLFLIAATPENVQLARKAVEKSDALRVEKLELLGRKTAKGGGAGGGGKAEFDLGGDGDGDGDGGWADDDDLDDEAKERAAKARAVDEEKKREMAQLAQATGKAASAENVKLEGVDEGVLGQLWVERTLEAKGVWPPTKEQLRAIGKATFDDGTGKMVGPLECPAVRRNLCMTMGRLNAQMLNSHPELVNAGQKGLIDPTYFKSNMEFRQRTGLLLEASLRVSMSVQSYRLAKTIVEAVSMFKIGTMSHDDPTTLEWFADVMKRQYGGDKGLPRLQFLSKDVVTPDEEEIATGDVCSLALHIERTHAENFTQQKLELCRKQGIPPEVAMQTYREGWWIMIRAKRTGKGHDDEPELADEDTAESGKNNPLTKMLDAAAKKKFDGEQDENRLCCAWPFIVSNVAQKQGKVNVKFKAPDAPGKYEFHVAVKSQEFLGADQEFVIVKEVLDKEEVERKQREEEESDDESGEGKDGEDDEKEEEKEPKKTK